VPTTGGHTTLTQLDAVERLRSVVTADADVVVAYLFGSFGRERAGPLSDVDVAVLLIKGADEEANDRLSADIATAVAPRRADVVVLNDAPVTLAYRAVRDGQILMSRDEDARIAFWVRTVDRYLDMAPARRILDQGLRRRLRERRFGRP